jgi:lipopolysaccharide transport system ATP-binding protein
MPAVIKVQKLSKQYRIGNGSPAYLTLRDTLVEVIEKPFSRFRNRNTSNGTQAPSTIWALNNVTFEVQAGEVIGVIGRNGSGKSTLLKILSRITPPTSGSVEIYGRSASLLEVGTGFHPELTGRENVYLNGAILGMSSSEIKQRFDEIVTFAEVEQFMNTPVKRYSTGMYLRLAFAVAAHLRTEILFIDEVLAVGDIEFQRKCLGKVEGVAKEGRTVILVSHNLGAVTQLCQRAFWLNDGILKLEGNPRDVVAGYVSRSNTQTHCWERPPHEDGTELQKEMLLLSVRFRQQDQQASVLSFDQPFRIEIEHLVKKPVSELRILFRIVSELGTVVFTSSDRDTPRPFDDRCRTEGRYLSVCTIPEKLLKPGKFFLTIGSQRYGSWIELHENLLMFEVSAVGTPYSSRLGVITPILDWDVRKMV